MFNRQQVVPYIARFSLLFSGFIALYLTAKYMGPFQRGVIAASTAMVSLAATIGGLSVGRTILYEIEKSGLIPQKYFKANLYSILILILALIVTSILFSIGCFTIFPDLTKGIPKIILFGSFLVLPYFMWLAYSSFIFSTLDKLYLQGKIVILNELIYVVALLIFFIFQKSNLVLFIFLTAFFRVVSVSAELFVLIKIIKPAIIFRVSVVKSIVKNGLALHLDSVSGFFIAAINVLIVNQFLNKEMVGQYDLAMRLAGIFLTVPAVSQIFISGYIARLGLKDAWKVIHISIFKTISAVLFFILIFFFIGDIFIEKIFGSNYREAATNIKFLTPYIIFNTLCVLFSPFVLSKGYFKTMSLLTLLLGLLNVGFGYLLIPIYGTLGMTFATNIVYTTAIIINIFYYFKIKKEVFTKKAFTNG